MKKNKLFIIFYLIPIIIGCIYGSSIAAQPLNEKNFPQNGPRDSVISVNLYDKNTNKPITNATVYSWIGSQLESGNAFSSGKFKIYVPSYSSINKILKQNGTPWSGYSLEISESGIGVDNIES